ncbi:MAG TPA: T9SS type A sorting domain-containing protein, partial [Parafilimonas sp.]
KEVDNDGKYIYSAVRFVKFNISVLTITPNPATTFIKITSTTDNLQIYVYDAAGRKVASHKLSGSSTQINISALPKGIYTVIADNNGTKVDSKKIVIQ